MNWEEKASAITINSDFLGKSGMRSDGKCHRYFTLTHLSPREINDSAYQKGTAYLEHVINQGRFEETVETVKKLAAQLKFFKSHLRLAKSYAKAGGEVEIIYNYLFHASSEGEIDNVETSYPANYGIQNDGKYRLTFPEHIKYDIVSINKLILRVSRLIEHGETRCLKHPRFKLK